MAFLTLHFINISNLTKCTKYKVKGINKLHKDLDLGCENKGLFKKKKKVDILTSLNKTDHLR